MSNRKKQELEKAFARFQDSGDQNQQFQKRDQDQALVYNLLQDDEKGQFNPPPPFYENDNVFDVFRVESTPNDNNNNKNEKKQFIKKQISLPEALTIIQSKISEKNSIENKISGLKLLCQKINSSVGNKQNCQMLCNWLQARKFINIFLHEDSHPQILRNMPTILKFLYENKQFSLQEVAILTNTGLKAHEQFVKLVQTVLCFIKIEDLNNIYQLISTQANLENNNFSLFLMSIVNNKYFIEEDLAEKSKPIVEQNNILSEEYQIQNKIVIPQILNEPQPNKKLSIHQQALKQSQRQLTKILTLNIYKFLIQATESHMNTYYPILNKLISSKQIFLQNQLALTLPQLLKSSKVNSIWILQHCLKLDFGQSNKQKGVKNQTRFNFIVKLVNQHLYQYLLVILARVRFNKVVVDKILNIMVLLSKNYKPLEDVYTQYIWKIIGLNSREQKQRQQFFNFVKDILRNQSNFTEESVYFIFFEVLMSLKAEWFSLKILDCLQMLFMRLNQDLKLISYTDQTYQIQNYDLVGINKFWYIYFNSTDLKVTKKCKDFLWKLTTYNNNSSQIKIKLFHQYINKIIQFMNESTEQTKIDFCNKGFQMIDRLMEEGQKKQQTVQMVQLNILNQCKDAIAPKNVNLKLSQKCRLEHLKQQISLAITPSNTNIKLLLRGQFLKGQKMTLRDLSISNGMTIMVTDDIDEAANQKKTNQQKKQNFQNNINQLAEIFGSEFDKNLLKYIAEKMQGHQLDRIVQAIMNQQKLATMTAQFQEAKANLKEEIKQQENIDGYKKIVYFQQPDVNESTQNKNSDLNKAFIQQNIVEAHEEENSMQPQILTSLEPAKFSTILTSNPQYLKQLLVCSEINKKRSWQTIKNLPNCPEFISFIVKKCQQLDWQALFPKQQQNEMACAYYAHLLCFILKNFKNKIQKYMIVYGGFGYISDWVMRVGEQIGTIVLEQVTNLLVVVLQQNCKVLLDFKKRIHNSQETKLLGTLAQQNKWIIGYQDTVFSQFCDEVFFSWLVSLLLKQNQTINKKLSTNIAQILIYYSLTNNNRLNQLLDLQMIQISRIIQIHGFIGEYIFLSALSKLLILNSSQMNQQSQQSQFNHKFRKFVNLADFGLQQMLKSENKNNVVYLYDIASCVLQKTNHPQKQLDIALSSLSIFRKNIESISPQLLSSMLKLLQLCLTKLFSQQANSSIKQTIIQPMSQFCEWLFQSYLFDLQKPGRHTRNKTVRKICYQILQIICSQNKQQAKSLVQKIIKIEVKQRNKEEDYIDFRAKDYIGLTNLGATCYINSLLQQIYHTKFSKLLLHKGDIDETQSPNISELKKIFMQLCYSIKNVVNPKNFIKSISFYGQPINTSIQQDAMQFLLCLFDYIEGQGCQQQIYDVFGGYLCNQILADEGQQQFVKNNMQHFNSLSIDILGKKNLQQALAFFIKPQILDGDNKYFCEELGKKMRASRRCYIQKMPNILVLTLKRFQFDYDIQVRKKINDYFQFPLELDMHKYSAAYLRNKQQTSDSKYKLSGILVHSGSAQSGHYYSYVKIGEQWFEFNDKSVTEFNIQNNLKNQCFGCSQGKKTRSAYMLFYQKVQTAYHGVYLDQIPQTNFYKKQINQQNAVFLKTRLICDQSFRSMLQKLYLYTDDQRLRYFIDFVFGSNKKDQKMIQQKNQMVYFNAEQNTPLMQNIDEVDAYFD